MTIVHNVEAGESWILRLPNLTFTSLKTKTMAELDYLLDNFNEAMYKYSLANLNFRQCQEELQQAIYILRYAKPEQESAVDKILEILKNRINILVKGALA